MTPGVVWNMPPGFVWDMPPGAVKDKPPGAVRGSRLGRAEDPQDIVLETELVRDMSPKIFERDTAVDSEVSCLEQHHLALGSLHLHTRLRKEKEKKQTRNVRGET